MDAIEHATMITGWYENLPEDEIPPVWMWSLSEELEVHFERVKADRRSGKSSRDDDDEEIEGPVMQNELALSRGRNAR